TSSNFTGSLSVGFREPLMRRALWKLRNQNTRRPSVFWTSSQLICSRREGHHAGIHPKQTNSPALPNNAPGSEARKKLLHREHRLTPSRLRPCARSFRL